LAKIMPVGLRIIDGQRLPVEVRSALMPGGTLRDGFGHARELPRFFYEVPSWEVALQTRFTPNLSLWEFIQTDLREAPALQDYPRYIPCAVTLLAIALQRFRDSIGSSIHIAANGGFRSAHHSLTCRASLHCWGTAADIYKIGDTYLDTAEKIEKYASLAREALPGAWTHPVGHGAEETDDHLHVDLGYVVSVPHHVRVDASVITEVLT